MLEDNPPADTAHDTAVSPLIVAFTHPDDADRIMEIIKAQLDGDDVVAYDFKVDGESVVGIGVAPLFLNEEKRSAIGEVMQYISDYIGIECACLASEAFNTAANFDRHIPSAVRSQIRGLFYYQQDKPVMDRFEKALALLVAGKEILGLETTDTVDPETRRKTMIEDGPELELEGKEEDSRPYDILYSPDARVMCIDIKNSIIRKRVTTALNDSGFVAGKDYMAATEADTATGNGNGSAKNKKTVYINCKSLSEKPELLEVLDTHAANKSFASGVTATAAENNGRIGR